MRFATILLLATAVSALRIQHKTAEPTEDEIKEKFVKGVKMAFKACDANKDKLLSKDEFEACAKKYNVPEDLADELKEEIPEGGATVDGILKAAKENQDEIMEYAKKNKDEIKKWIKKNVE